MNGGFCLGMSHDGQSLCDSAEEPHHHQDRDPEDPVKEYAAECRIRRMVPCLYCDQQCSHVTLPSIRHRRQTGRQTSAQGSILDTIGSTSPFDFINVYNPTPQVNNFELFPFANSSYHTPSIPSLPPAPPTTVYGYIDRHDDLKVKRSVDGEEDTQSEPLKSILSPLINSFLQPFSDSSSSSITNYVEKEQVSQPSANLLSQHPLGADSNFIDEVIYSDQQQQQAKPSYQSPNQQVNQPQVPQQFQPPNPKQPQIQPPYQIPIQGQYQPQIPSQIPSPIQTPIPPQIHSPIQPPVQPGYFSPRPPKQGAGQPLNQLSPYGQQYVAPPTQQQPQYPPQSFGQQYRPPSPQQIPYQQTNNGQRPPYPEYYFQNQAVQPEPQAQSLGLQSSIGPYVGPVGAVNGIVVDFGRQQESRDQEQRTKRDANKGQIIPFDDPSVFGFLEQLVYGEEFGIESPSQAVVSNQQVVVPPSQPMPSPNGVIVGPNGPFRPVPGSTSGAKSDTDLEAKQRRGQPTPAPAPPPFPVTYRAHPGHGNHVASGNPDTTK